SRAAGVLAWAGLGALLASAALLDEATVFPGWAALAPVLGTAALVAGGTASAGPARLLTLAPLQRLGALSYALYLVHWPLQVIPQAVLFAEQPLPIPARLALGAAAMPLAWLLHVGVEKPGIAWRALRARSAALTGALAVTASLAILATGAGIQQAVSHQALASPTPSADATSTTPAPEPQVPADLSPALDAVAADNPPPYAMGCHQDEEGTEASICEAGDDAEAPLVFLVGDSHAAAWFPALAELADEGRIRLQSTTKNSCLPFEVEQEYLGRPYTECAEWRQNVLSEIEDADPDLVVLAGYQNLERVGAGSLTSPDADAAARWRDGLATMLERIDAPRVAVMAEVPHQRRAPTHCLARNIEDAPACAEPRETAFDPALTAAEDEAIAESGQRVTRVDLTDHLCDEELCPTVIGDAPVYRDGHHLTQTYSRRLAEPMWQQVEPLLA